MPDATKKTFLKGHTLMHAGDKSDCAYIIESGSVEILVEQDGREIRIGTRSAGSLIGEMGVIDDKPRTATVRALEDCAVMELSRADFARRIEHADPVLKMVMHVILTRYRDLMARAQVLQPPYRPATSSAEAQENGHGTHDVALSAIKIHNELKTAIAEKQLTIHFQPIVSLKDMRIAGFEALMRWHHPERGMISPGIFIPVAEESGLIGALSRLALDLSCDAANALQTVSGEPLFISVNFSARDFSDGDFFHRVSATLDRKKVNPSQIHIEITESLLMEAPESAKAALEKCRDHGFTISIDDFGSGYSSLNYLHYFPLDTLKIDQSFVRAMTRQHASMVLVKSMLSIAHNLGMDVIAEGVETEKEAAILSDLGCENMQGFWVAKAMPLDAAMAFLRTWPGKKPVISSR
jgi:diguanylate cyclase